MTLTATSSNQAIVANNGIVLGTDAAGRRTITIKATGAKGSATVTINASDTELTSSTVINVFAGGSGKYILTGTGNPDLILGMGDADTLNGPMSACRVRKLALLGRVPPK